MTTVLFDLDFRWLKFFTWFLIGKLIGWAQFWSYCCAVHIWNHTNTTPFRLWLWRFYENSYIWDTRCTFYFQFQLHEINWSRIRTTVREYCFQDFMCYTHLISAPKAETHGILPPGMWEPSKRNKKDWRNFPSKVRFSP